MNAAVTIFAGLGLFFVGVKLISSGFSQLASLRLRTYLQSATSNPLKSAAIGALGGALTQSTNAITFIISGLVSSGTMTVRQGLPIVAWANIGTSILVFIAAVNITDAIFVLIGLVGICYFLNLDKKTRYRNFVLAMLGIALLLLGLSLIKDGSRMLRDFPLITDLLASTQNSPALAFLAGAILTPIVQTAKTVATVAVALVSGGLLSLDQTIMIVLGANLSSFTNVVFMGSGGTGTSRQVSYYQGLLKIAGVAVILPIFIADHLLPSRPGLWLLSHVASSPATQIAVLYLALQLAALAVTAPLAKQVLGLLGRLAPPTVDETLSRPRFVTEECLRDPVTGTDLVQREQESQIGMLSGYLNVLRDEKDDCVPDIALEPLRDANRTVMKEVDSLLRRMIEQSLAGEIVERVVLLQNRQEMVSSLQDSVCQFATHLRDARQGGLDHTMMGNLTEALHLMLSMLPTALADDIYDREALYVMTGDKSDVMENIRRTLLRSETPIPATTHDVLFTATTLYERIVWLIRRLLILTEDPRSGGRTNR